MRCLWVISGVLLCSACGSDAPSATKLPPVAGPLSCTSTKSGVTFQTTMSSCDEAITEGSAISLRLGRSTDAGAELIFTSMCSIIQGSTTMTYHDPLDQEFARELSSHGVCPGDVSLLVPA